MVWDRIALVPSGKSHFVAGHFIGQRFFFQNIESFRNKNFSENFTFTFPCLIKFQFNRSNWIARNFLLSDQGLTVYLFVSFLKGRRQRRDVMRERFYLWHSRIIPYEIDSSLCKCYKYRAK